MPTERARDMTRIPGVVGIAVAVIIGGGLVLVGAIYTETSAWNWVLHTREVLERIEATRYAVAKKNPEAVDGHERALGSLTADNPIQQRNVSRLAAASADEIEGVLADMRAEEQKLLAMRTSDVRRARDATIAASAALAALAVVLMFFVRSVARRDAARIAELNRTLEARVESRTRALQDANDAMEAFTYSVSHDLRAPLRGIHGYAEAVQEDFGTALPQEGRDYLSRIAASAARMEDLISDLLAYSRLSRDELELGPVPLDTAVAAAMQALKEEIAATGAKIVVAPGLGTVRAARPILVQAIQNLLSNAMKFVPPGTPPALRVESRRAHGHIRLVVADNGIGIAEKHQERIFRVFERLHGVDVYPGTGIGLAIVRKGVERMGGHVGVESEPGKGSRFWIDLPKED